MSTSFRAPPDSLVRAQQWARSQSWLGRFTLMNRLLLAMAFIPTGLVKLTGQRFTTLPVSNPVGFFFEAMYQTGAYWVFIGLAQVAAGVLLLVPATATLGALLAFPIIASIVLITWGVGFSGTVYVTAGMLLSVVYLLAWDGDRLWDAAVRVLGGRQDPPLLAGASGLEKAGWLLGGGVGLALFLTTRGFVPTSLRDDLFYLGIAAAEMVVAGWGLGMRRPRGS